MIAGDDAVPNMQAGSRRQAALSEWQRGFAVGTRSFIKSKANSYNLPLAPPLGELSSKARLRGAARSHGYRKTKANPYNPERTLYEFALDFIKPGVLTATPQPLRRQLPFQGRFG